MELTLSLPGWAVDENRGLPERLLTLEERMRAVIGFSRKSSVYLRCVPISSVVISTLPPSIAISRRTPRGKIDSGCAREPSSGSNDSVASIFGSAPLPLMFVLFSRKSASPKTLPFARKVRVLVYLRKAEEPVTVVPLTTPAPGMFIPMSI